MPRCFFASGARSRIRCFGRIISSASRSVPVPNATALSMHSGTAGHLPELAVRRARGSILRAPGRRYHGRQAHSEGTIHAGGPQRRRGSAVGQTFQGVILQYSPFIRLSILFLPGFSKSNLGRLCKFLRSCAPMGISAQDLTPPPSPASAGGAYSGKLATRQIEAAQ